MTVNDLMAIAAHLHVVLRRKTGRVTDIEWLVANQEYTQAVVDFAKHKSIELNDTDLELWALKLELANQQRPSKVQKPLVQMAIESVQANQTRAAIAPDPRLSAISPTDLHEQPSRTDSNSAGRYVGGIR